MGCGGYPRRTRIGSRTSGFCFYSWGCWRNHGKRDIRDLGEHPVDGNFVRPPFHSRPLTRRPSERQTSTSGKEYSVDSSLDQQLSTGNTFRSNHHPRESPIRPPPPPPIQTHSYPRNQSIPEPTRLKQLQGIRPYHLIRPHLQQPTVTELVKFSSTETFSVVPPPILAIEQHHMASYSLGTIPVDKS